MKTLSLSFRACLSKARGWESLPRVRRRSRAASHELVENSMVRERVVERESVETFVGPLESSKGRKRKIACSGPLFQKRDSWIVFQIYIGDLKCGNSRSGKRDLPSLARDPVHSRCAAVPSDVQVPAGNLRPGATTGEKVLRQLRVPVFLWHFEFWSHLCTLVACCPRIFEKRCFNFREGCFISLSFLTFERTNARLCCRSGLSLKKWEREKNDSFSDCARRRGAIACCGRAAARAK